MDMRKGRIIIFCSLLFIAGDLLGGFISLPPLLYLIASIVAASALLFKPSWPLLATAFILLGASAVQIGRMPPAPARTILEEKCSVVQTSLSSRLEDLVMCSADAGPIDTERGIFAEFRISHDDAASCAAVLKALAIGDRSSIGRGLKDDYRKSGAMHLLALSGLHVGLIYKIIGSMLFFLGGSLFIKRFKSLLILLILWTFALVSGMSPSIARAALMISIYELSSYTGGRKDGITALAISAFLIVLFSPEAPRRIGFQLSFAACLSIFLLYPRLSALLSARTAIMKHVWNTVCLAVVCQIATGPIVWLAFGSFPKYFMLSNLLAVPLVPAIFVLLFISCIFSSVPFAGGVSSRLLLGTILILNKIIHIIAGLDGFLI